MSSIYQEIQNRHQKEFNEFPIKFAFSTEQFKNGLKELGLNENDSDKVVAITGGGFIRKTDVDKYVEMVERFAKEDEEMMKNEQYVYEMFSYELDNHEYGYTRELDDTLEACGLTMEEIEADELLKSCLEKSLRKYRESEV